MAKRNSVVDEITYAIDDVRQKLIEQGWTGSVQTPQHMQNLPDNMAGIDTSVTPAREENYMERFHRERAEAREETDYQRYKDAKEGSMEIAPYKDPSERESHNKMYLGQEQELEPEM